MFDVKTPLRTYYLAASSEEDMNAWVNCICEVCNLQDLSKPQQPNTGDTRQCNFQIIIIINWTKAKIIKIEIYFTYSDYNITNETSDQQASASTAGATAAAAPTATNPSLVVTLKSTTLSPVKSSSTSSDQIALLPTAEPIDNNNSVYQNYDAMCRNSNYNNRETLICDVPLNKHVGAGDGKPDARESYYNFMVWKSARKNEKEKRFLIQF